MELYFPHTFHTILATKYVLPTIQVHNLLTGTFTVVNVFIHEKRGKFKKKPLKRVFI